MGKQQGVATKYELAGKQETKHLWLFLFYVVVLLTILFSHFGFMPDISGSTVALLVILALPFLLPYLKSIEAFGVKVDLRDEVRELKKEVRIINKRFDVLTQASRAFLQLKPLSETWENIDKMKIQLEQTPLSEGELERCLASIDPNERLPGYIQLQVRPQLNRLEQVVDCLFLESFLAHRSGYETRPMWQAIHTIKCIINAHSQLPDKSREYTKFIFGQVLQFLRFNSYLDKGNECKRDIEENIQLLCMKHEP